MSKVLPFAASKPAFGNAVIANCETEQIHLPGSIQPHGALLVLDEQTLTVTRASQNAAQFLLHEPNHPIIGCALHTINSALADRCKEIIQQRDDTPTAIPCELASSMDCVMHRASSGHWILEFEQAATLDNTMTQLLRNGITEITEAASLQSLCDTTAKLFKDLFGYDRVMIYRFAFEGHGEVFAEQCEHGMDPYLGNHYPASDIPQIARNLYIRTRIRMLADVDYQPSSIRPKQAVGDIDDLDMSLCHLRSMSPMHRQYLQNMEVKASLVTSLLCGNSLWGLITCHHNSTKTVGYQMRVIAELLSETIATRISALEGLARARAEQGVQRFEQGLTEAISTDGDWTTALLNRSGELLRPLDAVGAVLTHEGEVLRVGAAPEKTEVQGLINWLDQYHPGEIYFSPEIGNQSPHLGTIAKTTPGVLACPVSGQPGEYLIWFRPEHVRTICWGGKPGKIADGIEEELTPRTSFAKWTEELQNTADNWSETTLSVAQLISSSVADVIQQFRAMRAMIAHNQLESLYEQITISDLPALIADTDGNILLRNNSFDKLLWDDTPQTPHISDLTRFFEEKSFASQHLMALLEQQQSWHGSATLDGRPVLIRADAIFTSNKKVLGYIILLTDISDRQMAENARRRFPQRTIEKFSVQPAGIGESGRELYEYLLEIVVENAQLAAMEITDGIDMKGVPTMLEGVEASVTRTSRLIGNLIRHTESASKKQPEFAK